MTSKLLKVAEKVPEKILNKVLLGYSLTPPGIALDKILQKAELPQFEKLVPGLIKTILNLTTQNSIALTEFINILITNLELKLDKSKIEKLTDTIIKILMAIKSNKFFNKMPEKYKKIIEKLLETGWKQKYIKYKTKYLKLKRELVEKSF
jgi:hypothetical protein